MSSSRASRLSRTLLVAVATAALVPVVALAAPAGAGEKSCDVLTRREVRRAIGHPVKPGVPPIGVGGECSFTVKGSPLDVVNVWVLEGKDAENAFETGKQFSGDDAVDLPKFGEDAYYLGEPFYTAYVLDDDTLVFVQYYVLFGDDSPQKIKRAVVELTGRALERATS